MIIPTYERRFFIRIFTEQVEKEKEKMEEIRNSSTTNGKGKRVTKVTGKANVAKFSGQM